MNRPPTAVTYEWVQDGFVQGGHNVICEAGKKPHVPHFEEMRSIPLRHSDVVADIGAYCGLYALHCARHPVKKVMAYEPTPRTMEVLRLSPLPNLATYFAAVTGQEQSTAKLFISGGIGVTNSLAKREKKIGYLTVPAIPYAQAVKGATIVKIDVEGAEYSYPIYQEGVRAYLIDFHPVKGNWKRKAQAIIESLLDNGFKTIVQPNFENGWTSAGAWLRDSMDDDSGFAPMLSGVLCCGCGKVIHLASKGLCLKCYQTWLPRHRAGYLCEELSYG